MEQKFSNNSIDLQVLREFCEREGEAVVYHKGDQLEREGNPARWIASARFAKKLLSAKINPNFNKNS